MNNIKIYLIFIVTILTSLSSVTLAQSYNAETLSTFAKQFLKDNLPQPAIGRLDINVSKLDPRIKINSCEVPLQANIPEKNYSRNLNIKIFCVGENAWKIYIPVKVNTVIPIIVAKNKINKGTILSKKNIMIKDENTNKIHGDSISNIADVLGTKAKRNISKYKPLSLKYICYVCKGDGITITAESNNLYIKTYGRALESGSIGDTIKVKNIKSNKTVFAEVISINQVRINL